MATKAVQGVNRRSNGDSLAEDGHHLFPFHQPATQRAVGLKAYDQDLRCGLVEIELEVMQNAAGVAHACPCQHDTRSLHVVNLFRNVILDVPKDFG